MLVGLVMTWLLLNGLDLSWLAGMLSAGLLYYALYRLGMVTRGQAGPS